MYTANFAGVTIPCTYIKNPGPNLQSFHKVKDDFSHGFLFQHVKQDNFVEFISPDEGLFS